MGGAHDGHFRTGHGNAVDHRGIAVLVILIGSGEIVAVPLNASGKCNRQPGQHRKSLLARRKLGEVRRPRIIRALREEMAMGIVRAGEDSVEVRVRVVGLASGQAACEDVDPAGAVAGRTAEVGDRDVAAGWIDRAADGLAVIVGRGCDWGRAAVSIFVDFRRIVVDDVHVTGAIDALAVREAQARDLPVELSGLHAIIIDVDRAARRIGDVEQPLLVGVGPNPRPAAIGVPDRHRTDAIRHRYRRMRWEKRGKRPAIARRARRRRRARHPYMRQAARLRRERRRRNGQRPKETCTAPLLKARET